MIIKQLSVFVENKQGKLVDVLELLGKTNIDLRALSIADTADFGILRIIVDKSEEASTVLQKEGYIVRVTDVLGLSVPDTPGSLAKILRALSDKGINVEYTYAFVSHNKGEAYVVLRVENNEEAKRILAEQGIRP